MAVVTLVKGDVSYMSLPFADDCGLDWSGALCRVRVAHLTRPSLKRVSH